MQTTKIKRSIYRIALIAGFSATMVACKKDKNNNPGPDPVPNSQKIEKYSNGEDYIRFTYNTDGSVKTVILKTDVNTGGDEVVYTVAYNAQKKIESLESAWQKIVPEYENNSMIRAKLFEGTAQVGYTNFYFENGNLKKSTLYAGEGGVYVPVLEYDMTYNAQGNISQTVVMMASAQPDVMVRAGHIDYEYDQKTNPLYAYRDLLALFWQSTSKNNITVENHFDANMAAEDKFVYTYTYKTNGLPEKATVKEGLPGEEPITTQVTYTYQ